MSELDHDEFEILASVIYGDVWCRKPSLEQSMKYDEAAVDVFAYYLDIDMPIDWYLKRPSVYGTGHTNDVPLMLGKS